MNVAERKIEFTLNGTPVSATVSTLDNVVDVLNTFDLRGARESCGQGLCGCCTVLVDGEAVSGCLKMAAMIAGKDVRTVEGMDASGTLDPIQQAFIETGAFQCGFCTPGMILMTQHLLDRNADPTDEEIRRFLAGNLCRCGAYPEIIEAVHLAVDKRKQSN